MEQEGAGEAPLVLINRNAELGQTAPGTLGARLFFSAPAASLALKTAPISRGVFWLFSR